MSNNVVIRDPLKRVVEFAAVRLADGFHVVILLGDGGTFASDTEWETEDQALLFADGHVDGLLAGAAASADEIDQLLSDPIQGLTLELPLDLSAADKAIVKEGVFVGLGLAARGYWIDIDEDVDSAAQTMH